MECPSWRKKEKKGERGVKIMNFEFWYKKYFTEVLRIFSVSKRWRKNIMWPKGYRVSLPHQLTIKFMSNYTQASTFVKAWMANSNLSQARNKYVDQFGWLLLFSHVQLFATPWTAARQVSLSLTISRSLLKLMSIASVMPSSLLILCCPLLWPPSIFPSIRLFSKESVLHIRWPKILEFQLQHQSFQRTPRTDLL